MDFPQFQFPGVGHGMTIGLNAVTHVVLSHGVAMGAVFLIVLTELIGYLRRDETWDHYAHFAIVPVVLTITSFGAITGVGIWFTIGTLAPRAASSMLRVFFWPWWVESIDFLMEEIILLSYYLLWEKMKVSRRSKIGHISLGFSYMVGAWLSTLLITGIIGFQLTPDRWLWNPSRWIAWTNPSLWPQTWLRFFGGLAIGGVLMTGLLFFWRKEPDRHRLSLFRTASLRLYGIDTLVFSVAVFGCWLWYYYSIEPTFRINYLFAILTSHISQHVFVFWLLLAVSAGLVLILGIVNVLGWHTGAKLLVVPGIIGAIALTTGFERIREFIRGPYVMASYLYASELTAKESAMLRDQGMLPQMWWYNAAYQGKDPRQAAQTLFSHNCNTCHTIGGLNDIRRRVQGRTPDGIAAIINHTDRMVPWMPPFSGNSQERQLMAAYFYELSQQPHVERPTWLPQHEEDLPRD
jgi:mono/diheme cytochrome c family protein